MSTTDHDHYLETGGWSREDEETEPVDLSLEDLQPVVEPMSLIEWEAREEAWENSEVFESEEDKRAKARLEVEFWNRYSARRVA